MKRIRFIYFLCILLILTCFSFAANAQAVSAEAKLDIGTIKIGDQTNLRLIVHQPANLRVIFPKLVDTLAGKVVIVGVPKIDTVADNNDAGQLKVTQSYVVTSFDQGTYAIPAFSIGTPGGTLKTNDLTLVVQTVQVDTSKAIYDIKQPMAVTYTLWDWLSDNWVWVLMAVLILALIGGAVWYYKTRPKKDIVVKEAAPIIPEHIIALNKLNELRSKKLWQQDAVKQYHSELSDVMREYLERRFMIKTHEKTTDEILVSLRYMDLAEDNRNKLKSILVLADLVKFAKEKPLPAENEESMDNAITFVLKTQQVAEPPKNAEGGVADGVV